MRQRRFYIALFALVLSCASSQEPDPRYQPAQNVLEVVAVLRRHIPDDTYRFAPARDFAGRNVYRATLARLENFEQIHSESLRAGHMNDVLAFSKGRALERIRAFDLAASSYRQVGERDAALHADADSSARICETLFEVSSLGRRKRGTPGFALGKIRSEEILTTYERQNALLENLAQRTLDNHYAAVVHEELEFADIERAHYFVATRYLRPDGDVQALAELQRVAVRHRESKLANQHLLALANLYAELADEYVRANPPQTLQFDPPTFEELAEAAMRLYEAVANQDGTPEKLEAGRRLEAFLAFALRVDGDRFTP